MKENKLLTRLQSLSHGSQEAVQSGSSLSELDHYMHVERPIEQSVCEKMDAINSMGGGLLLLVGSAGDGKSHIISSLKSKPEYKDFKYRNDATETWSTSGDVSAVQALKYSLRNFNDSSIDSTNDKLLVAINLGVLLDFIEDNEVKTKFTGIVKIAEALKSTISTDFSNLELNQHIKVVSLAHQQCFELLSNIDEQYPVNSKFLSALLDKVTLKSDNNPFYNDYLNDSESKDIIDPVRFNYELLLLKPIRKTIVKMVIEAVVRFNLIITPRDFLDFIYQILVYPRWKEYSERSDFFSATLPSLLFSSSENKIQKALSELDPIKYSSVEHDKDLSELSSSGMYIDSYLKEDIFGTGQLTQIKNIANNFYANSECRIDVSIFLFRLKHLLEYHSEKDAYKSFIKNLQGYYINDSDTFSSLDENISKILPRYYGSYFSEVDHVPLNIQGKKFKLFSHLSLPPAEFHASFDVNHPNLFNLFIDMKWNVSGKDINLKLDYPLYEHLYELRAGKLSNNHEGDKNLNFSLFIRQLSELSNADKEVVIIDENSSKHVLMEKYNKIQIH
jgi:DNA phosphorothioation-dependent restriction protein DptF